MECKKAEKQRNEFSWKVKKLEIQGNEFLECKKVRKTKKYIFGMKIRSKNKENNFWDVKNVEKQGN